MKAKVFEFFKNLPNTPEEQFNKAFALYRETKTKNLASERFYNAAGYSEVNRENILYDLKQAHNITDAQIRMVKKDTKVSKLNFILTDENVSTAEITEIYAFLEKKEIELPKPPVFKDGPEKYLNLKAFVKENAIPKKSNKKVDLLDAIANWFQEDVLKVAEAYLKSEKVAEKLKSSKENNEVLYVITTDKKEEVFPNAPEEVKETIKLRDEFPFLNETDCPDELYILVGKKFAHYDAYVKIHEALFVLIPDIEKDASPIPMTPEQIFELAVAAVENFEVNQQIYEELKYYDEHKKVLGKHPIFEERKLKEKLEKMTTDKLVIRKGNLDNYIRRDEKKLANLTGEVKNKLQQKINKWKIELGLVNAKLGFSE